MLLSGLGLVAGDCPPQLLEGRLIVGLMASALPRLVTYSESASGTVGTSSIEFHLVRDLKSSGSSLQSKNSSSLSAPASPDLTMASMRLVSCWEVLDRRSVLILLRLTAPLVAEFSDRQRLFLWTISLALGMMLGTSCELYSMLLKLLPSESGSSPVSHSESSSSSPRIFLFSSSAVLLSKSLMSSMVRPNHSSCQTQACLWALSMVFLSAMSCMNLSILLCMPQYRNSTLHSL